MFHSHLHIHHTLLSDEGSAAEIFVSAVDHAWDDLSDEEGVGEAHTYIPEDPIDDLERFEEGV